MNGTCRLIRGADLLVVTTMSKRGEKLVKNVQVYIVEDVRPDPAVASPAYSLTKPGTGEVWHVSVNEFGAACDCPSAIRLADKGEFCKHLKSMMAVGLVPGV